MKRYDGTKSAACGDGDYVLHDEAQAVITAKDAQIAALVTICEDMIDFLNAEDWPIQAEEWRQELKKIMGGV
jgi:hypothetical protein